MHNHKGYQETYERIMQFNKNKKEPFHRWYPFVEGYSKEFIQSIIQEMGRKDLVCLEPFSGSGTTALELQRMGIPCFSFEVNPMMYLVARVKLEGSYCIEKIEYWHNYIIDKRVNLLEYLHFKIMQITANTPKSTFEMFQGNVEFSENRSA